MKTSLFNQGPDPLFRVFLFSIISIALILFSHRLDFINAGRNSLGNLTYPILRLADAPVNTFHRIQNAFSAQQLLIASNARLERKNQLLETQLLQLRSLKHENQSLRQLLNSSQRVSNQFMASRLLAVSMSPLKHKIILDKGSKDNLQIDMPILDEFGIMGRLSRVYGYHSEATLMSDPNHAIPVRILRSSIRSIATGVGRTDRLKLLYLPVNADVKLGDEVVTSGLGGKFPADYPVGEIREIVRAPNAPFARILIEPHAKLDTSREIIVITSKLTTMEGNPSVTPPLVEKRSESPVSEKP